MRLGLVKSKSPPRPPHEVANKTSEVVSTRTLALVALVQFRRKALSFDHGGRENEIERKGEAAREERE